MTGIIKEPKQFVVQVWPAYVMERFIMEKMYSMTAAMDVLNTLDEHMTLEENIRSTYVIMRMAASDLMHVLKDHKDPQLAVKHRTAKRVIQEFHKSLAAHDMVEKPKPEWFIRECCAFMKAIDQAMRGQSQVYAA